jgi:hypothetical protein
MHVVSAKKRIVLLGMMTKMPVAGVVWQNMHYVCGFERLGHEVYYVEAHARTPSMFMETEHDDGSGKAAAFLDRTMKRFGVAPDRWAYHALHEPDGQCYGMSETALRELYASADLIINLHGGTAPLPEHAATGRLVYLETDPVALQIELHDKQAETIQFLEPHVAFFTFGENYGNADCGLPVSERFKFMPTRQPVVMDFWENRVMLDAARRAPFTTIGNWEQRWRTVEFNGETFHWSKHFEFLKFLDLPKRAPTARFELALSSCDQQAQAMLEEKGWAVRSALALSGDPNAYRDFIAGSRGEFTVAKDQNVRLRSGWFSDRSATYLAAGRPVITQDTGFGNVLPTGEGLFAFHETSDVLAALEKIDADYERQCSAAHAIASDYFAHDVVLRKLIWDVGL